MKKVTLIGASGFVGAAILNELLSRGHMVKVIIVVFCLLTLSGCNKHQQKPMSQNSDQQAITSLIDRYIESINQCDTAIVNDIWSHDSIVSFVAPSGYYKTHNEIRDSLVAGLFGKFFTTRELQKENLKISVNGNMAWIEFSWKFNALRLDGTPHATKGFETQIVEKDANNQWKLVHIHYSARKND